MKAVEDEVTAVNEAFYRAFRERDPNAMEAIWARQAPVACVHPGMPVTTGRGPVLRSWRGILSHPDAPKLSCSNVVVHLLGTSAFVTCLEGTEGAAPRLVATNVYTLEEGRWRMVHHHAAPLAQENAGPRPPRKKRTDPSTLN